MKIANFLKECDFSPEEWLELIDLSAQLKVERASGNEPQRLAGKAIALIFEKTSTRTRTAFEIAAFQLHVDFGVAGLQRRRQPVPVRRRVFTLPRRSAAGEREAQRGTTAFL